MAIAIYQIYCNEQYTFNSGCNCCSTRNHVLTRNNRRLVLFYAYNSNISSVEQEWLSDAVDHYHTDLGLYVDFIPSSGNIQVKNIHKRILLWLLFINTKTHQVFNLLTNIEIIKVVILMILMHHFPAILQLTDAGKDEQ